MPSDFPLSPKLLKGALVVYESQTSGLPTKVIAFQYNPEQLSRSLATRGALSEPGNVGGAREDVLRVLGPPVETVNLSVELDAADQLTELHSDGRHLAQIIVRVLASLGDRKGGSEKHVRV
jgi:hypothetical protein